MSDEEIKLELNTKTIKRAGEALAAMKDEFSKRTPKRPAEELIRQYINDIDELSKLGASLPQIYERLNKAVPLGITPNSFAVYVRRVRKEIGSERYSPRTAKDNAEAAPSARAETTGAPEVTVETAAAAGWNCAECESKAERRESTKNPGKFFWRCSACGTNYRDNDGKLTSEVQK